MNQLALFTDEVEPRSGADPHGVKSKCSSNDAT